MNPRTATALVLALVLGACSDASTDAVAPSLESAVVGSYTLARVNDQTLPAVKHATAKTPTYTCSDAILSGSLALGLGARYALDVQFRRSCTNGTQEEWVRRDHGLYSIKDDRIVFNADPSSDWGFILSAARPHPGATSLTVYTGFGTSIFERR